MNSSKQACELISQAISGIDELIITPNSIPVNQLIKFKQTLSKMLREIETNNLPPRQYRRSYLGHVIADSWPYDLPVVDTILDAERAYLKL